MDCDAGSITTGSALQTSRAYVVVRVLFVGDGSKTTFLANCALSYAK
jgi:hypothetical protein